METLDERIAKVNEEIDQLMAEPPTPARRTKYGLVWWRRIEDLKKEYDQNRPQPEQTRLDLKAVALRVVTEVFRHPGKVDDVADSPATR